MVEIAFRRYEDTDKEEVINLHLAALSNNPSAQFSGTWDIDLANIQENYLDKRGDFLVGIVDDTIVAMGGIWELDETTAEMKRVRVHPDFQRKEIGETLIKNLEDRAKELGYTVMQLDTPSYRKPAQRVYEKNGYQEFKREKLENDELIFYRKDLLQKTPI